MKGDEGLVGKDLTRSVLIFLIDAKEEKCKEMKV